MTQNKCTKAYFFHCYGDFGVLGRVKGKEGVNGKGGGLKFVLYSS